MLGYPDQALRSKEEAQALARRQAHPLTLALALLGSAMLHQLRREPQAAQAQAEEERVLCAEQGFALVWGLGPDATGLGLGGARTGGRGATPDTRGNCHRSGHRRWSGGVAVAPGHVGRGLWPSWSERRRAARWRRR